ncbi:olfactory receptor 5L2-like [Tiliqua scincoides]|uniref:olfactory receptor 5L2-like n=1 Tax=Tiliqua scincoides TaxID=71010 RepID=UPI003462D721
MPRENNTQVSEFILTGLTDHLQLQIILFVLFLVVYAVTLVGNLSMIVLIWHSPQLHTPMYFFLSSLSVLDIGYSSSVTPKFLTDLFRKKKTISFAGCFTQLYFYAIGATTECYLLAVMAYDRYVAICNPLLYLVVMSQRKCILLVALSYFAGIVCNLVHIVVGVRLSYCGPNIINNFYCDGPPLFALSCSDITLNYILIYVIVSFNMLSTSLIVLTSYAYILLTIVKIRSAKSRQKAFSTCTSHLTAISILYGCLAFMYARPSSNGIRNVDKIASLFYVVVTPMLNPLIYSLRNQEVKNALRKILKR